MHEFVAKYDANRIKYKHIKMSQGRWLIKLLWRVVVTIYLLCLVRLKIYHTHHVKYHICRKPQLILGLYSTLYYII